MTLRGLIEDRGSELARVMRERRTQTNKAARCAVLLPALAQLPGPLALNEVGAAAGLTLLHDFYSYDYDGHLIAGRDPDAPTLQCHHTRPLPLPDRVPEIGTGRHRAPGSIRPPRRMDRMGRVEVTGRLLEADPQGSCRSSVSCRSRGRRSAHLPA
jgi:hypothetical protein